MPKGHGYKRALAKMKGERDALAAQLDAVRDARAVWQGRKVNGQRTPVQAGDLVAQMLTDIVTAVPSEFLVEVRREAAEGAWDAAVQACNAVADYRFDIEHGTLPAVVNPHKEKE